MKRMIKHAAKSIDPNMEIAAECVSEVSDIVLNMFMEEGYSRSEALQSFRVSLDSVSDTESALRLQPKFRMTSLRQLSPNWTLLCRALTRTRTLTPKLPDAT